MLEWTLPKLLWGEVWQGHCTCRIVSRPGRLQCWQNLPQCKKNLLWKGDSRRTVWTWMFFFACRHRPCIVGQIIIKTGDPWRCLWDGCLQQSQVYKVVVTFLMTFVSE